MKEKIKYIHCDFKKKYGLKRIKEQSHLIPNTRSRSHGRGVVKWFHCSVNAHLTYNEMGTSVLRMITYDQKVKNPENKELFSPSLRKRKVLNWSPILLSQIEFPIARIIPKHTRNPKIWNKNRSREGKVNVNPEFVKSTQCSYKSISHKKLSFENQII